MSPQRAAVRQKGRAEEKTSSFFLFLLVQEKRAFQKPLISLPDTKVMRKKKEHFFEVELRQEIKTASPAIPIATPVTVAKKIRFYFSYI